MQTLSADVVLSVTVGEDLKSLLTGERQIGQEEDPPIVCLPDEDSRRITGLRPFRSIAEWKCALEKEEMVVRRLSLHPTNGRERGRLKTLFRIWKLMGATERELLDLLGIATWTDNPEVTIIRAEVDMGTGSGTLHLWCGKTRHG